MKKIILTILLIVPILSFSQELPDFYRNYGELMDTLWALQAARPDIIDIFPIGITSFDSLDIYAVKVSNNVQQNRDIPRLLFVGVIHGEEIMMTELVLDVISEFANNNYSPWTIYRQYAEIYFVPVMNVEGYNVVLDELDITYRKNKRDNIGDGLFRYQPVMGYDSSGVDPNRNFDFNWVHGDTLFQGGHAELYDYYRGSEPFSEGMTRAIRDLAVEKNFCLGIIYHQSRSTTFSEKVIYPWNWKENGIQCEKIPPDSDVIADIGTRVANLIQRLGVSGTYEPNLSGGKYGNSHDWFYAKMGGYVYTIETSGIQLANYDDLMTVVDYNKEGLYYLIQRAIGYGFGSAQNPVGQLTGKVTDAFSGLPVMAEVKLLGRSSGILSPRFTDSEFGRYRRLLLSGGYNLEISAPGYQTHTQTITVGQVQPTVLDIALQPLPTYQVNGTLRDLNTNELVEGTAIFIGDKCDTVSTINGGFSLTLPEGQYQLRIDAEGYVSRFEAPEIYANHDAVYMMSPAQVIFADDFESGAGQWSTGGNASWGIDYTDSHSGGASIADSPNSLYGNNIEAYIETEFNLSDYLTAHLSFWHKYYLEPEYDFGYVVVSTDNGSNWQTLGYFDLQDIDWYEERFDLTPFCGNNIKLRFTLDTDQNLMENGWNIDDVKVGASDVYQDADLTEIIPQHFYIKAPYPNPFNSSIVIEFYLDKPSFVEMRVFDISGRLLDTLLAEKLPLGNKTVKWEADSYASGIYFISFQSEINKSISKAILLK